MGPDWGLATTPGNRSKEFESWRGKRCFLPHPEGEVESGLCEPPDPRAQEGTQAGAAWLPFLLSSQPAFPHALSPGTVCPTDFKVLRKPHTGQSPTNRRLEPQEVTSIHFVLPTQVASSLP